jgi:hypothetical protein
MPRRNRTASSRTNRNGLQEYTKREHRLVLPAWLNSLVGCESTKALLEDCKDVAEGCARRRRSHLSHHLWARGSTVRIPEEDLARYEENIRMHLERLNHHPAGALSPSLFFSTWPPRTRRSCSTACFIARPSCWPH